MWTTYLCGWLIASVIAFAVADSFPNDPTSPPRARGALAVVAGALWPVLLVGIVQVACVGAVAKSVRLRSM
jgi:hypothetical protein